MFNALRNIFIYFKIVILKYLLKYTKIIKKNIVWKYIYEIIYF